jgi:hypothetical protein
VFGHTLQLLQSNISMAQSTGVLFEKTGKSDAKRCYLLGGSQQSKMFGGFVL